jgi:hypothetical protein
MAIVKFLISRSLPSKGSTCHNILSNSLQLADPRFEESFNLQGASLEVLSCLYAVGVLRCNFFFNKTTHFSKYLPDDELIRSKHVVQVTFLSSMLRSRV